MNTFPERLAEEIASLCSQIRRGGREMRKHAAAAASTLMALISTAESFVSAPPSAGGRRGSSAATCSTCVARLPPGCTSVASLSRCSRAMRNRRRSGNGVLSLQAEGRTPSRGAGAATEGKRPPSGGGGGGGGAAAAAAAGNRRRPVQRRKAGGSASSVEGAIGSKQKDGVEELKDRLKHFASLRMWRQAATAFDKAKADGLPITASAYTYAINAMSKGGRWKEAIALLDEMVDGGPSGGGGAGPKIAPSVVSYNAAITACSRGDKMPAALRLLGEMSSRSGLKPDIYSYAAVMSGLAKARNPGRAARLLGEMRAAGVAPDLVCLASAMEACEKKGASKEAAEILEQVRELEPPPSADALAGILTSAIAACVTEAAWEQATDWLTDIRMSGGGRLPPASAYAAAANACARAGQGVRARALITELEGGGSVGKAQRPTLECYNAVVLGYAMAGDMEAAVRTLKVDVPKAGLKPDTQGFNHLLQGYARLADWKAALTLLDEQRSGEFPDARPNRVGYNAAMDACGRAGQVEAAVALLNAMRAAAGGGNRRLRPDRYSYGGALQACRVAGDADTALRLLGWMRADGVRGNQRCSLVAFSAVASTAGREDEAAEILEDMVRGGVSTSEGALSAAREALEETLEAAGGGGGGGGDRFARAMAAFNALEEAQAEKAAAKAQRAAAAAATAEP